MCVGGALHSNSQLTSCSGNQSHICKEVSSGQSLCQSFATSGLCLVFEHAGGLWQIRRRWTGASFASSAGQQYSMVTLRTIVVRLGPHDFHAILLACKATCWTHYCHHFFSSTNFAPHSAEHQLALQAVMPTSCIVSLILGLRSVETATCLHTVLKSEIQSTDVRLPFHRQGTHGESFSMWALMVHCASEKIRSCYVKIELTTVIQSKKLMS